MIIICPMTSKNKAVSLQWPNYAGLPVRLMDETEGAEVGYLQKVQKAYKESSEEIIAYFHSDLTIHDPTWDKRVLKEFEDPEVAVISFFGAKNLGRDDIYKIPYDHTQLARGDCYSNLTDAESHGQRFTEEINVAMIDSFSLIVRRSFLYRIGGWPMHMPPSHGSDMFICMMAARHRMKVRLVGIDCSHTSGGVNSGTFNYPEWAKTTKWGSDAEMHRVWHEYLYNEFRDVLPIRR